MLTVAPPRRVMNSRRRMCAPERSTPCAMLDYNRLRPAASEKRHTTSLRCRSRRMSALGPLADINVARCDVRFAPESGH